jgi:ABC-type multidrug transport system fused ATPase/permease subunit
MHSLQKNLQWEYLSNKKPVLLLYVGIGLAQSCSTFLLFVSIGEFFTIHFHSGSNKGRLLQLLGIHLQTLSSFFLLFILLLLIKASLEFLERWLSYQEGELYVKYIREKLFAAQIRWDSEKFQEKHFGNYLLRYSNDMKTIQNYLTKGIMGCIKDLCFLVMGFFLLWMINHRLAIYLLFITSGIMVIIFIISGLQRKVISNSRSKRSNLLAFVTKSFHKHASIKTKNTEEKTGQRFNMMSDQLYHANMANNRFDSALQAMLPMFQYSMIGLLLWLMTLSTGTISVNDALVFVLIALMMVSPMKRVLKVPAIINKGKISLGKINGMLNPTISLAQPDSATQVTNNN